MFQFNNNVLPNISNQASQTLANTYNTDDQRAMLIIFSPRTIVNTCKRPVKYNFDYNFIENIKDNADNIINSVGGYDLQAAGYMNNYDSSLYAVGVDAQGVMMNNSNFSDYYTWLLIIDNESISSGNVYSGPKLSNRYIYSGFCNFEPYSSIDGLKVTINPQCVLTITHSTTMAIQKRYSALGDTSKMRITGDVDYILPDVSMQLNNNLDYLLTPDAVQSGVAKNDSTSFYADMSKMLVAQGSHPIPVPAFLNSPKHHLCSIVGAINRTLDEITTDNFGSGAMRNSNNSRVYGDTSVFRSSFNTNLNVRPADIFLGLDCSRPYTILELQARYPMLQIIPSHADKISTSNLADQGVYTRANIASSILVAAVPSIAADNGLCEIGLLYKSYKSNNNMFITNMMDDSNDEIEIKNCAPFSQEDIGITKMRVKAFLAALKNQVFPIIKSIGGDFDLSLSCNAASECDVLLFFMDDRNGTTGIYESPLLLGGLNSPLIGPTNIYENNGQNLGAVLVAMSEMTSNLPGSPFNVQYPGIHVVSEGPISPNETVAESIFGSQRF